MRLLLLFIATFLFAKEKLLITNFENLQPFYYNHQYVNLKMDILSAKDGNLSLIDDANNSYKIFKNDIKYYSNIHFKLNNQFPKFTLSLKDNNNSLLDEINITINSKIKQLHFPKNFCGVIANKLIFKDKILTNYDDYNNILYLTIFVKNGDLKNFNLHLKNEKLYFIDKNETTAKYYYSALVPLNKNNFKITYFNLIKDDYETINFFIPIKDETISTQVDIKPMNKNNIYIIDSLLLSLLILIVVLYYYKRKIIYIILSIMILLSLLFLNWPKKEITLKYGTQVHILPFEKSTIFFVVNSKINAKILKTKNGYKKIEFNNKIGWIKDE